MLPLSRCSKFKSPLYSHSLLRGSTSSVDIPNEPTHNLNFDFFSDDYRMPMLIPTNSNFSNNVNNINSVNNINNVNTVNNINNVPKSIIIRPSQILPPHQQQQLHQLHQQQLQQQQQQLQQLQNSPQDLSRTSVLHPASAAAFRPTFMSFDGVPQISTNIVPQISTNSSDMTGTRVVRTSSGLIELKNFRMVPGGQRVILAPNTQQHQQTQHHQQQQQPHQQQQQIPSAQNSLSDSASAVHRSVNGVTLGSSIKRPYQSSPPGIRLVSTSSTGTTITTMISSTPSGSSTLTSSSQPFHIPASLLRTLQVINQTKQVSGEREKLLPVAKRVQLQK